MLDCGFVFPEKVVYMAHTAKYSKEFSAGGMNLICVPMDGGMVLDESAVCIGFVGDTPCKGTIEIFINTGVASINLSLFFNNRNIFFSTCRGSS